MQLICGDQTYYQSLGYNISFLIALVQNKKQMVYVKMNIIANTTVRGGEMIIFTFMKTDDKMNTVNGTKQESGNENKTKFTVSAILITHIHTYTHSLVHGQAHTHMHTLTLTHTLAHTHTAEVSTHAHTNTNPQIKCSD